MLKVELAVRKKFPPKVKIRKRRNTRFKNRTLSIEVQMQSLLLVRIRCSKLSV